MGDANYRCAHVSPTSLGITEKSEAGHISPVEYARSQAKTDSQMGKRSQPIFLEWGNPPEPCYKGR
jgi:hypothetical protein